MAIDFSGRTVLITGAGSGLGRAHALGFAKAGAIVVVNDIGEAAAMVADEIIAAGGTALAHAASVTDREAVLDMMGRIIADFGRLDCLINNAGILRDSSFHKMSDADWHAVIDVHLNGTATVTHAAWPHMREAGYGRVVMTTSSSGLFGNFGQVNYGAAKMAQVGMMTSLAIEGQKYGINVNAIAPIAWTQMTAKLFPPAAETLMAAEAVTPGVLFLASEAAPTGTVLSAGGGAYARVSVMAGEPVFLGTDAGPDAVAAAFETIDRQDGAKPLASGPAETATMFAAVMKGNANRA